MIIEEFLRKCFVFNLTSPWLTSFLPDRRLNRSHHSEAFSEPEWQTATDSWTDSACRWCRTWRPTMSSWRGLTEAGRQTKFFSAVFARSSDKLERKKILLNTWVNVYGQTPQTLSRYIDWKSIPVRITKFLC